ncbi:TPA: ribonuclease P protein subunit [Candidatus Woesearchaeota archaeon]|nr:ribonuclease P protein subunit [Candidatus Woesearchaeota archaeon]
MVDNNRQLSFELIGRKVKVVKSKNMAYVGKEGLVIDETKSTITIQEQGKKTTLLKNGVSLAIEHVPGIVEGKNIQKRPEERITK